MFWDAMWARFGWELAPIIFLAVVIGTVIGGIIVLAAIQSALKWVIGRHLW